MILTNEIMDKLNNIQNNYLKEANMHIEMNMKCQSCSNSCSGCEGSCGGACQNGSNLQWD